MEVDGDSNSVVGNRITSGVAGDDLRVAVAGDDNHLIRNHFAGFVTTVDDSGFDTPVRSSSTVLPVDP